MHPCKVGLPDTLLYRIKNTETFINKLINEREETF